MTEIAHRHNRNLFGIAAAGLATLAGISGIAHLERVQADSKFQATPIVEVDALKQALEPEFDGILRVEDSTGNTQKLSTFAISAPAHIIGENLSAPFISTLNYRVTYALDTGDLGLPVEVHLQGKKARTIDVEKSGSMHFVVDAVMPHPEKPGTILLLSFNARQLSTLSE